MSHIGLLSQVVSQMICEWSRQKRAKALGPFCLRGDRSSLGYEVSRALVTYTPPGSFSSLGTLDRKHRAVQNKNVPYLKEEAAWNLLGGTTGFLDDVLTISPNFVQIVGGGFELFEV